MIPQGKCESNPTGGNMKYYFFFAKNCEKSSEQELDASEQIEPLLLADLDAVREEFLRGEHETSSSSLAALVSVTKKI